MTLRNSKKEAAALSYTPQEDKAPKVVASGEGFVAQNIIKLAREANVPIVEDVALISALMTLELGEEIPVELYEAVAQVLAFLYQLDKGDG
ncbi:MULTISPECIES: EscU/YscU/HrcU family type III secretion system export apparatus switch protein [Aminobacterium]|jgi:flagellar biosynthesis protein|uniref:EscU/YscU/HrcU family type III secretion system export apparatus switch protein n=1 Tax=Aminobacterium TaxID=81466 RepID=UPI00257CE816|nr:MULTISPECIES: EscU/YscU/HrcU family type III secretion system export apparatus switch protein [unclassified Aminobacterium]